MKELIEIIGLGSMMGTFIVFFITFMTAYSRPKKEVVVEINNKGEAKFEFVLLIILMPIVIYTFFSCVKKI